MEKLLKFTKWSISTLSLKSQTKVISASALSSSRCHQITVLLHQITVLLHQITVLLHCPTPLSYSTVLLHCPTPLSYSRCHQITVLDTNSRRLSGLVLPWSALMDTSIFLRGCSSLSPRTEPLYKHPNVPAK